MNVPEDEREEGLGERLAREEGPGILRWLIDGARDYLRHGLDVPESVTAATRRYREREDIFGAFLAERTQDAADQVGAGDLLAAYVEWTKNDPAAPRLNNAGLAERMAAKGYDRVVRRRTYYLGLRLIGDAEER